MDIGKSFSYVFEDPRWVNKILIGGLMALFFFLIVPMLILFGYMLQTMRNIMNGQQHPLPEWGDFGTLLVDGLKAAVVIFVYMIPYFILSVIGRADNIGVLFSCVGFIYSIAVQLAIPAIIGRYLETGGDIGSCFQIQAIIEQIRANISDFVVILLLSIVTSLIASAGFIACYIGIAFTFPYALAVNAHLWSQLLMKIRGAEINRLPMGGSTPL